MIDVVVNPEGGAIRINGAFNEIETKCSVDLNRRTVQRQRLGDRIPGDECLEVVNRLLQPKRLVNVARDPVRFGSNCPSCQYFVFPGLATGFCAVNGLRGPAIPIPDARSNSCRFYYLFLWQLNSPQRLARDICRRIPIPEPEQRSFRLTPVPTLSLPGKVARRAPRTQEEATAPESPGGQGLPPRAWPPRKPR